MQLKGVIDRLRQKFIGIQNSYAGASKIQKLQGLGYDSVVLPFLALLTGLVMASFLLGIEAMIICVIKSSANQIYSKEDNYTSLEAEDIIREIRLILLNDYKEMGGMKFLTKIRKLCLPNTQNKSGKNITNE